MRTIKLFKRFYGKTLELNMQENRINDKLTNFETFIKYLVGLPFIPFGFTTVRKNTLKLIIRSGKIDGYMTEGLHWRYPYFNSITLYCGDWTKSIDMTVTDIEKNPIHVSVFLTYIISDPSAHYKNLCLEHEDKNNVLENWIDSMIRNEVSKYSYNDLTSDITSDKDRFKSIKDQIIWNINHDYKCDHYGIELNNFGIKSINYTKEVQEILMVKQKTLKTIEARKEITDSTLMIINDIHDKIGDKLNSDDKSKLTLCLINSLIGNQSPTPTLSM